MLYWVLEHPSVLERLLREISQHLPTDDWERLARLPYLKAVCHESLRMYPIVTIPTGRKLRKPRYIDGYEFDAGVTLLPCTYLVHHRPELYPEPEEFRPERFLDALTRPASSSRSVAGRGYALVQHSQTCKCRLPWRSF